MGTYARGFASRNRLIKSLCGITAAHRFRENVVQDMVELGGGDHSMARQIVRRLRYWKVIGYLVNVA